MKLDNLLGKCEKCGKLFAMKNEGVNLKKTEKTFKLVNAEESKFETIEKKFYEHISICKYCKAKTTKTVIEEV